MKVVTVSQMQKAERGCAQFGISLDQLMENAGKAFAIETRKILVDLKKHTILVLVGPGNNGGDGLVAARYFHEWGARVQVYLCGQRQENDPNLEKVLKLRISCYKGADDSGLEQLNRSLSGATAVVDSLFGTGTSRPLWGLFAQVLNAVRETKKLRPRLHLIALDLSSGLNADTGSADPATLTVDNTITLGFPKTGLYNLPGAEHAGKISVVDIGIPASLVEDVKIDLLTAEWMKSILPKRSPVAHKGTFGKVLALAGSINYLGAAYLSCSAVIRTGAGLATLAVPRTLLPILGAKLTEVTFLPLPETEPGVPAKESADILRQALPQYDVWLLGCGIGQGEAVRELVETVLMDTPIKLPPIVLDADGLNALVRIPEWQQRFSAEAIFTPHAGEMSRLLGKPVGEVQNNRLQLALEAASEWRKIVVLKGAYTVIASPDGRARISPFANPGLASAGTGDVLAGTIAGIATQGLSLFDAAACGVYLHAGAGEIVRGAMGDAGMLASDLLPVLPYAIRQLKED